MRNCLECGAEYHPVRKDQRYCSKACRTVVTIRKAKMKRLNGFDEEKVKWLVSQVNSFHEENGMVIKQSKNGFTESLRTAVKERDNYNCQVCNKVTDLEVHHIIPKLKGGKHTMENLITLCKGCHKYIEAGNEIKAINKCFKNYKRQKFEMEVGI